LKLAVQNTIGGIDDHHCLKIEKKIEKLPPFLIAPSVLSNVY
jgi:hypothetical protein